MKFRELALLPSSCETLKLNQFSPLKLVFPTGPIYQVVLFHLMKEAEHSSETS
jgi:hypothetical protein